MPRRARLRLARQASSAGRTSRSKASEDGEQRHLREEAVDGEGRGREHGARREHDRRDDQRRAHLGERAVHGTLGAAPSARRRR